MLGGLMGLATSATVPLLTRQTRRVGLLMHAWARLAASTVLASTPCNLHVSCKLLLCSPTYSPCHMPNQTSPKEHIPTAPVYVLGYLY